MQYILLLALIVTTYFVLAPIYEKVLDKLTADNPIGLRGGILWIAALAFIPWSINLGPHLFSQSNILIKLISIIIFAAGLDMAIYGKKTLGKFWSPKPTIFKNHKLISNGPYSIVRHPIYLGQFIMAIGLGLIFNNAFALLFFTVCLYSYNLSRPRVEEKLLLENLKGYDKYREKVPMMFPLPKVSFNLRGKKHSTKGY